MFVSMHHFTYSMCISHHDLLRLTTVHVVRHFPQGLEMTAKGVQRWSTNKATLRIEQLKLHSELNSLLEKLASHYDGMQ